jgi:hypothetical protein
VDYLGSARLWQSVQPDYSCLDLDCFVRLIFYGIAGICGLGLYSFYRDSICPHHPAG